MKPYLTFFAACLLAANLPAHADGPINSAATFKKGKTITPYFAAQKTGMAVHLKVWTAGSTTKLKQTKQRLIKWPNSPCSNPNWEEQDFDLAMLGEKHTSRTHLALNVYTECEEKSNYEWKVNYTAAFYSGNVKNGASYLKQWAGWELSGVSEVNWDNDAAKEVQLFLTQEKGNKLNARVIYINPTTGKVESDKTYPIASF